MRRVSVAGPAPDRLAAGLASGAISTLYALEVLVAEPLVPRGLGYGNRRRGVKCDTAAGTAAAWRMKVRAKQLWAMMTAMSLTGVSFASTAGAGAPAGAATAVTANTISAGMITGTTPTATKVTATASGGTSTGTSAGATTPVPAADGQSRVANKVAAPFTGMVAAVYHLVYHRALANKSNNSGQPSSDERS